MQLASAIGAGITAAAGARARAAAASGSASDAVMRSSIAAFAAAHSVGRGTLPCAACVTDPRGSACAACAEDCAQACLADPAAPACAASCGGGASAWNEVCGVLGVNSSACVGFGEEVAESCEQGGGTPLCAACGGGAAALAHVCALDGLSRGCESLLAYCGEACVGQAAACAADCGGFSGAPCAARARRVAACVDRCDATCLGLARDAASAASCVLPPSSGHVLLLVRFVLLGHVPLLVRFVLLGHMLLLVLFVLLVYSVGRVLLFVLLVCLFACL